MNISFIRISLPSTISLFWKGKKKEKGQNQELREKKIQRLKKEYKEKNTTVTQI